jgi:outer membrane protein assembly factor BamB
MKKIVFALIAVFLVCSTFTPYASADWVMFGSNPSHTGVETGSSAIPTQAWKYTTESFVDSAPAVADGVVYFGSGDCRIYAVNKTTGLQIWNYSTSTSISSSAAVANGIVYIGSGDGGFYALNATNGVKLWKYATNTGFLSSPACDDGVVFIGSMNKNLYAFNADNGNLLWKYTTGDSIESSPTILNNVVYVGSDDHNLYALNAMTGLKIWNFSTGGRVFSSPTVTNGTVYFGSFDQSVYAIDAASGSLVWSYKTGGTVFSSPAVNNGIVYIGSGDHNIYALNASTGAKIWSYSTGGVIYSYPAVANNVVYCGSWDYKVYALAATDGSLLWSFLTGSYIHSAPAISNDYVYIGSQDHSVYALNQNTLSTIPISTPVVTATPSAKPDYVPPSSGAPYPTPPDVPTLGPVIICSSGDSGTDVKIFSHQNQSYSQSQIQLSFSVVAIGMFGQFGNVGYSLDGGTVKSFNSFTNKSVDTSGFSEWYWYKTTAFAQILLPKLFEGAHNLTVYYGWQYLGIPQNPSLQRYEVYAYANVNFTVVNSNYSLTDANTDSPASLSATSTPTVPEFSLLTIPLLLILMTAAGLLVYFKKHKQSF